MESRSGHRASRGHACRCRRHTGVDMPRLGKPTDAGSGTGGDCVCRNQAPLANASFRDSANTCVASTRLDRLRSNHLSPKRNGLGTGPDSAVRSRASGATKNTSSRRAVASAQTIHPGGKLRDGPELDRAHEKASAVPSPAPPAEAPRGRIEELNCASCSCPVTLSTSTPASQITPGECASGFSGRARMHVRRGVWPLVAFNRRHQVKEAIRSIGVAIVGMVVMPHVAADTTATVPTPVGYKRDLHMRGVTTLWTRRACWRLVSGGHLSVHSIASRSGRCRKDYRLPGASGRGIVQSSQERCSGCPRSSSSVSRTRHCFSWRSRQVSSVARD